MSKSSENADFIAAPSPADVVVTKPPRARVSDAVDPDETPHEKLERKRDYLEGFLQKKPEGLKSGEPGGDLYEAVIAALKEIYDPEIPVNIYDLGLIYEIDYEPDGVANIRMTLTAPNCPMADMLVEDVNQQVAKVKGVKSVNVILTFDPVWDKSMMSEEALLELNML